MTPIRTRATKRTVVAAALAAVVGGLILTVTPLASAAAPPVAQDIDALGCQSEKPCTPWLFTAPGDDVTMTAATLSDYTVTDPITGKVVDSTAAPAVTLAGDTAFQVGPVDGLSDGRPYDVVATIKWTVTNDAGSDSATATLHWRQGNATFTDDANDRSFWKGGPTSYTFDPAAVFRDRFGSEAPARAYVQVGPTDGSAGDLTSTVNADGTITLTRHTWPTKATTGFLDQVALRWCMPVTGTPSIPASTDCDPANFENRHGELARTSVAVQYPQPVDVSGAKDDSDVYVQVGKSVPSSIIKNDVLGSWDTVAFPWWVGVDPAGAAMHNGVPYAFVGAQVAGVTGETHSHVTAVSSADPAMQNRKAGAPFTWDYSPDGADNTQSFEVHGDTIGDDALGLQICPVYPDALADGLCKTTRLTVHTVPRVAANDDAASTDPNVTVNVDVLNNDSVNNVPTPTAVQVVSSSVPAGVKVTVAKDRTVSVTADKRYVGKTVAFDYRDVEKAGEARATVRVKVRAAAAPVVGPTARDDHAEGRTGEQIKVPVLANDRWTGTPKVALLSAPKGVKARVVRGNVVVTVPHRLGGGADEVLRYRLTDSTGKSDTAKITVATLAQSTTGGALTPSLPDPPTTPVAATTASASMREGHVPVWVSAGGGLLALVVATGGALLVRRRRTL